MAAPHVTAAITLIRVSNPNLSMAQAIDRLFSSADVISGLNVQMGRRLNLANAVGATTNPTDPTEPLPTAPDSLRVSGIGQTVAEVQWNDAENETSYRVELAEGTGAFRTVADLPAGTVSFLLNSLTAGQVHTVRVTAGNRAGSASSDVRFTTADTPPSVPNNLQVVNYLPTTADIRWSDTANETGYRVELAEGAGPFTTVANLVAGTDEYRLTGLKAGQVYLARVTAINSAGSAYAEARFTTIVSPPAPTNVRVNAISATDAEGSWDYSALATSYRIEIATGTGPFLNVVNLSSGSARYRLSRLSANQSYTVRIVVVYNEASAFADAQFTTIIVAPSKPMNLRATNVLSRKADLAWNRSPGNHNAVRIWQMNGRGKWELMHTLRPGTTSFHISGLPANSGIRIRVSVWNDAGEAFSDGVVFKTKRETPG